MERPRALVLRADGINCDEETAHAFSQAGARVRRVHINHIIEGDEKLSDNDILALSGGFSYGDHIRSGIVLAAELRKRLDDDLGRFIDDKGIIIGICNGFQVLVNAGLLPTDKPAQLTASLEHNDSGRFETLWPTMQVSRNSPCPFLSDLPDQVTYMVAHGEGRFETPPESLCTIEAKRFVAFRYIDRQGQMAENYPDNPNGAMNAIAGICSESGLILGMMPHPERFVETTHYPNWRRVPGQEPQGLLLFMSMVNYIKNR